MKEKEEEAGPHGKRAKSAEEALAGLMRYAARAERSSGDALRLMRRWNVPEADRERILHQLCESSTTVASLPPMCAKSPRWRDGACTRYGLGSVPREYRPTLSKRPLCGSTKPAPWPTDCRSCSTGNFGACRARHMK